MTTENPCKALEDLEGLGPENLPQLDTQETSQHISNGLNYRAFLVSGMPKKMAFAEKIYRAVDLRDDKNRLETFRKCRSTAWFIRHKETQEIRVASSRCNLRWCPLCIKTKRFVMRQGLIPWVKSAKKPKFITLTLKHSNANLGFQIDSLYAYFGNLRRSVFWKKRIFSGVWFFQVKKSKEDNLWHPHLHIICDGNYLCMRELSERWEKITGGSKIVDVRAVKDPEKAAEYVSRYATSPVELDSLDMSDAVEAFDSLHGRRICGAFGKCRGLQLVPQRCPDAEDWEFLASFGQVMFNHHSDDWHKIIYECWKNDKPCPCVAAEPPPDSKTLDGLTWFEVVTYEQLEFEFSQ